VISKTIPRASSSTEESKLIPNASPILIFPTAFSTPLQGSLFEIAPDSHVADLIAFASSLADFCPKLLEAIADDLEASALADKQRRLDEKRWRDSHTAILVDVSPNDPPPLKLETGRPRITPLCVLAFLLLRGWFGKGYKDAQLKTLTMESLSLRNFMENMGCSLPAASTLEENLSAISNNTLHQIHCAELALALNEELDDFKTIRGDSTAVDSASAYPTDSGTIAKLLCRMCSRLEKLEFLGLGHSHLSELANWKAEFSQLRYRIGTLTSSSAQQAEEAAQKEVESCQIADNQPDTDKKESAKQRLQRELYKRLYALAEEILPELEGEFIRAKAQIQSEQRSPREQGLRERFVAEFNADIEATKQGIEQSRRRVCEGRKPSASGKMPLSVSDLSASFILKGGWDKTFGYRPQLSFSAGNLVTALLVPEGNAADQGQYIPLVKATIENTGVVPKIVSTDDGYTGAAQLKECLELGVEIVSFSGARGKALIGDEKWDSEPYEIARRARNGAESGIGVLKAVEGFGQLATCGIDNVRGELLGKVISYNALKIVSLRKRKYEEEHRKRWNAGLPGGKQEVA
jgi:hypothetical protein